MPDTHLRIAILQHPTGSHRVELIQYVAPHRGHVRAQTNAVGTPHLALEFDDLDTILPTLLERGVQVLGEVMAIPEGERVGGKVAYSRDPDGIILELLSLPAW